MRTGTTVTGYGYRLEPPARGGRTVTDPWPCLGASGHLVVLRAAGLRYLLVHPLASAAAGPGIRFMAEVPTPGREVHTAQFTVDVHEAAHR